jgi:hypothetical protein
MYTEGSLPLFLNGAIDIGEFNPSGQIGKHIGKRQAIQSGVRWQRHLHHQQTEAQENQAAPIESEERAPGIAQIA